MIGLPDATAGVSRRPADSVAGAGSNGSKKRPAHGICSSNLSRRAERPSGARYPLARLPLPSSRTPAMRHHVGDYFRSRTNDEARTKDHGRTKNEGLRTKD